jgi:hypothetical protein
MFAFNQRKEIIVRVLLIVAILFSAPMNSFTARAADETGTPTPTVTDTPTTELNVTSTQISPDITETPIPVTETPVPAVTPTNTVSTDVTQETASSATTAIPSLMLSADPSFIPPSGIFTLIWTVEGFSFEGSVLKILLPVGTLPHAEYVGTYDEANHTLLVNLTALSGEVELVSTPEGDHVEIQAALLQQDQIIDNASISLSTHEQFIMDKQGGEITAMDGKLKLEFPKDTLSERAVIEIGAPSGDAIPAYSLSGKPFEIKAHDAQSNEELKHFSKELSIFISYADLDIAPELERSLYLYWYNPETGDWEGLPSTVDTNTKTVQTWTDHFTVFDLDANQWQATHLPSVDAFQVSSFTGAATYSMSIEVPTGPGGFQPSLTLSYNSQVVDQSTLKTQASWVGMGWSLETGSIELDTHGTPDASIDDSYMLNVGGISTHIVQDSSGAYHTTDEDFWKIQYNSGTDTWQVSDKEGNQYFFEQRSTFPYQPDYCSTVSKTYL